MLFTQLVLFTFAGCGLGILTGVIPGVHINLVSALVLASLGVFAGFPPIAVAAMILAMSVTHTFLDFIPSVLLGAPDGDTALSVLPGHQMLLDGRAAEAIRITGLGSLISLLITGALFLGVVQVLPRVYTHVQPIIPWLLLAVLLFSLVKETYVFRAATVIGLAGLFGVLVLGPRFGSEFIFPALSGLFGVPTLLLSLQSKSAVPKQIKARVQLSWGALIKNAGLGSMAGMLVGLLPGLGSAQATYLVQATSKKRDIRAFLTAVSAVNTANIIFTLVVLYALGKTRSGIVIVIRDIVGTLTAESLGLFLGVILLSGGVALGLHLGLGALFTRALSGKSSKVNAWMSGFILVFIVAMVALLTQGWGLFILLIGTALGLFPPLWNVRRAENMAFFLIPVLLFYFGLNYVVWGWLG